MPEELNLGCARGMMAHITAPALSKKAPRTLRKGTALEDSSTIGAAALMNQEDHILTALELRLHPAEVLLAIHRYPVDLEDHIAAGHACVFSKGAGLHVLDDNALSRWDLQAFGNVRSQVFHGKPELAFHRLAAATVIFLLAFIAGEELCPIRNSHRRVAGLAAANVAECGLGAGFACGNLGDKFIAVLDLF